MLINGAQRVPEDPEQAIMRYSNEKQYHIKTAENLLVIRILYHDLRDYKSFLYSLFLSKSVVPHGTVGSNPTRSAIKSL